MYHKNLLRLFSLLLISPNTLNSVVLRSSNALPFVSTPNSWATKAAMPTPRGVAASVVLDNKIYVLGGWTTQDSAAVEVYDPIANSWETKANMPTPRNNLTAAVVNGKIYAIAGWSGTANTAVVEVYDPTSNTWSTVAPLPVPTNGLKAAVVANKIYVFGGWRTTGLTNAVMMYDPGSNIWITRSDMPTARTELAVAVINNRIFALGGSGLNTVEIYDPVTNTWTAGVPMPLSRTSFAATTISGKIYISGGGDSTHLRFDPVTGIWQTLTPVPTGRWGPISAAVAGQEYVIGGWSTAGDPNTNEVYTLPAASNPVVHVMGSLETTAIQPVLSAFVNQTGFIITYQQSNELGSMLLDCQAQTACPDIAIIPNPRFMKELAQQGTLQPLDAVIPSFDTYYAAPWRRFGSFGGTLFGVPVEISSKTMVWYRPQTLAAVGATPPEDWNDLLGLADVLVANEQTPFAIGAESGAASGWPLTDIFENILVRTAGPNVQRRLVDHTIAWTDPVIVTTMQNFSEIIGNDNYVVGGSTGILTTSFWDAVDMVLGASPSATMYFGASWTQYLIDPNLIPLVDYNYFQFPQINPMWGSPITGGGDLAILFENSVAARSFIQFLATPAAAELYVISSPGRISPNNRVNLQAYSDPITRAVAEDILATSDFLFDMDDQLPAELQSYLFQQLLYFVAHQDQITVVLQRLEQRATELQGAPYSVFVPLITRTD